MRKRLVFFINSADLFLSHRRHLSVRAVKDGWQVIVICPPGPRIGELKSLGYEVREIDLDRKSTSWKELVALWQLRSLLRELRPTVLHNFTIKCCLYGSLVGRWLGIPQVVNSVTGLGHVFIDPGLKAWILRLILHALYRTVFASKRVQFIFQNQDDFDFYRSRGWIRSDRARIVAGTGIDTMEFRPPNLETRPSPFAAPEPVRILYAGRYLKEKGLQELFAAAEWLSKKGLSFELQLCGRIDEGNPSRFTEAEWRALTDRPYIRDLGFSKQMVAIYQQASVVCLPSYREGLPLSLIEAASCARPIVATDVPGCREVVLEGKTGFLVAVRDSRSLADALEKLILNSQLREEMGRAGRELVLSRFDREIVVEQGLSIYSDYSKTA